VCYGLGNFATCVTARSQLAFLLLFLEECQVGVRVPPCPPTLGLDTCTWPCGCK
jgi:hypothetical protein